MTRYALYFTPSVGSPWRDAGCHWLGRDPTGDSPLAQPSIPNLPGVTFAALTRDARRYGLHATLKPPFRLAEGFSAEHLAAMAQAFCEVQQPVELNDVRVRPMGDFLALRPSGPDDEVAALAMRCVTYFDLLRAPPTATELARRRRAGLTPRQDALLQRWGYPYTEEQFRFHLTLTDSLRDVDADTQYALRKAAEEHFAPAQSHAPMVVDALTIFCETEPGSNLTVWRHFPFGGRKPDRPLPEPGRLFYFVGPSGVGKDALLRWVQEQIGDDAGIVFARRTITRPAHPSELHEAMEPAVFWHHAATGHFAMMWQANDLCYGVRRGIEAELAAGRDVVVNGSREYVPQLRFLFPDASVVWVDADASQIRERLESRKRESGAALLRRLERASQFTPPDMQQVVRLENSGPIEIAGRRLLELLRR
jgi:phosphonate metabolism protein PhnN/1,5-bisphosphokinase (PRPP-forming)